MYRFEQAAAFSSWGFTHSSSPVPYLRVCRLKETFSVQKFTLSGRTFCMFPSWAFTDSTSSRCILFKGFTLSHWALNSSSASVWVCVFVIVIFTNSTYQVQTRAELCISCDLIDLNLSRACVICLKIHWLKVVLFLMRDYSFQKLLFDFWGFIGFKQLHDSLFDWRFTHSGSSILWKFTLSVVVFYSLSH